jgi:predicted permease
MRVWLPFIPGRHDQELEEEIAAHLAMATRDRIERGEDAYAAAAAARREFGNQALIRETAREMWGWLWVERLLKDFRYAVRQVRRSPGFAATVIGSLSLGIGAAAAMFTVVDRLVLEPVRYRDAGRLVSIGMSGDAQTTWGVAWLEFEQWQKESRSFEQMALAGSAPSSYLQGKSDLLEVRAQVVSANLFSTLGAEPEAGRGFLPESPGCTPGKNLGTIVISDALWRAAFGAERSILGRQVRMDNDTHHNASYTVVGVMPPGFRYPAGNIYAGQQVWLPLQLGDNDKRGVSSAPYYQVIARLRRGVSPRQAAAEVAVIQKRVIAGYAAQHAAGYADPDTRKSRVRIVVRRYEDTLVGADVRRGLLALLAAAGVLWLIAGVNVTNLMLARSTARQREIAMRGALGASRWRVMQQTVVEGLVLSFAAALLGAGLAISSVRLLAHELTQRLPLPVPAMPDGWIPGVLLALTVVSALMASAWPAWVAARNPIEPALRQGGAQTGMGRKHHRLRGVLVSAEIALSLMLLAGCGLLLRTITNLHHVPLGYRTDHILVAHLTVPSYRFTGRNVTADLYQPLLERVQHLRGVESVGLIGEVPLGNTWTIAVGLYSKGTNGQTVTVRFKAASPGAQRVFDFPMAAGRYFNDTDTPTSQPVVVVNEAFARAYSSDKHNVAAILGQEILPITLTAKEGEGARVIGVMADIRQSEVSQPSQPELELCIPQLTPDRLYYKNMVGSAMDVAVRSEQSTAITIPELRSILKQANPALANSTITSMDEIVEDSLGSQRLAAHLLEIFGGAALLLCVAGLYGLLAYVVTQRRRELGVRMALGAKRRDVVSLVMRQAGIMLLVGLVSGTALALASARLIERFLYGVSARDGWALGCAATLLLVSGLIAAWFPARAAASVDPMRALRTE